MATDAPNTEVEETEENPEVEIEETDETEDEEEFTPPSKEETARMKAALKARKKERDDARRELAALKSKGEEGEAEKPDPDLKVKRLAGIAALTSEGLSKDQAKVALRLLDLTNVEVDDDGDADFEDAIEELKETFPNLFAKEKPTTGPRRVTTADRGGRSAAPSQDKTGDRLLKQAGYR